MVPRLLAPTHNTTSINQRHDQTKIDSQLLEPLNAFIAGTEDHTDIYQVINYLHLKCISVFKWWSEYRTAEAQDQYNRSQSLIQSEQARAKKMYLNLKNNIIKVKTI